MPTTTSKLSFEPLTDTVGAAVIGLDPANLTAEDRAALREAWVRYHVLVVRRQPMTEEQQIDFAKSFGTIRDNMRRDSNPTTLTTRPEIMVISNIKENGVLQGVLPDGEMQWHFDGLHQAQPYFGAVLHGIEIPSHGGETRFINTGAVYSALPAALRERLKGLHAEHVYDYSSAQRDKKVRDENAARSVHPILRIHDESGEPALYVSRLMTERIVELPEAESDALLGELYDAIDAFPSFYEHQWSVGDTVIWDNRSVSHSRNDFDASERRLLKRVTIIGR